MKERQTDICDQADELIQMSLTNKINEIRSKKPLQATGKCLNCDEQVEGLFCDVDCRDDYDYRNKRGKINGSKGY